MDEGTLMKRSSRTTEKHGRLTHESGRFNGYFLFALPPGKLQRAMTLWSCQSTQAGSTVPTYVIRTRTFRKVWTQRKGILSNVLGTLFVIFQLIGANGGILPFGGIIIIFSGSLLLQIQYLFRQQTLILCSYGKWDFEKTSFIWDLQCFDWKLVTWEQWRKRTKTIS